MTVVGVALVYGNTFHFGAIYYKILLIEKGWVITFFYKRLGRANLFYQLLCEKTKVSSI